MSASSANDRPSTARTSIAMTARISAEPRSFRTRVSMDSLPLRSIPLVRRSVLQQHVGVELPPEHVGADGGLRDDADPDAPDVVGLILAPERQRERRTRVLRRYRVARGEARPRVVGERQAGD